jgi:hypothetical protein
MIGEVVDRPSIFPPIYRSKSVLLFRDRSSHNHKSLLKNNDCRFATATAPAFITAHQDLKPSAVRGPAKLNNRAAAA